MAPGWTDLTAAVRASCHLLLGHGLATQAIRAAAPGARIGIVNNLSTVHPATDRPEDLAAARRQDGHVNRWWLDPVPAAASPPTWWRPTASNCPWTTPTWRPSPPARLARPELLLPGVRHRRPGRARAVRPVPSAARVSRAPGWTGRSTSGIETLLLRLTEEYGARRIYGHRERLRLPGRGPPPTAASTTPSARDYLERHLAACASAVRKGRPAGRLLRLVPAGQPSSGPTATTSGSAWSTSTTAPRSARSRAAATGTRTSSASTAARAAGPPEPGPDGRWARTGSPVPTGHHTPMSVMHAT